jgi:hypothetical protein
MIISDTTLRILKNFQGINGEIVLHPGNHQYVGIKDMKIILATATLPEAWPQETGILELSTFLSMLSQFKNPDVQFEKGVMVVSTNGVKVRYRCSDTSLISVPAVPTLPTDTPGLEFVMPEHLMGQVIKQCLTLKLPWVKMDIDSGKVMLRGVDNKNALSHTVEFTIPDKDITVHDAALKLSYPFKVEHLNNLMDGPYKVAVSDKWKAPYAHFANQKDPVAYFIVAQHEDIKK